jgi:CBS-domain-containing membrane protein
MRHHLHRFTARHEPAAPLASHLKSGAGAALGLGMVGLLAHLTAWPLLVAPLGATVVLIFGHPASPLSQPANVFGGYLLATILGVVAATAFPGVWGVAAVAVGLALAAMLALRITHPPAGAVPLVAMGGPADCVILFPALLLASISLVALAVALHRLPPQVAYPRLLPPA